MHNLGISLKALHSWLEPYSYQSSRMTTEQRAERLALLFSYVDAMISVRPLGVEFPDDTITLIDGTREISE
jgi:hypothetical protein